MAFRLKLGAFINARLVPGQSLFTLFYMPLFGDFEHDLADMRVTFHQFVRLGGLVQAENLVDHRFDASRLDQRPDNFLQFAGNFAFTFNRL